MGLILDSSILIAAEKRRFNLEAFFAHYKEHEMCITAITVSEILHGVERANSANRKNARSALMEKFISDLEVLNFGIATARQHAFLWALLEKNGTLIGPHDLLIAATALEYEYGLATLNIKEFDRVPGLRRVDIAPFTS